MRCFYAVVGLFHVKQSYKNINRYHWPLSQSSQHLDNPLSQSWGIQLLLKIMTADIIYTKNQLVRTGIYKEAT